ncbi:DPH3 [Enterospora canceri]|uniref:Diphthamide biosynthesis protein 3 n=1 Tax=Enterospora canceri TaxID=1081671 RepID=A0A1Y1S511_9MICR|nr:DPH3 [Enterospora canceri]
MEREFSYDQYFEQAADYVSHYDQIHLSEFEYDDECGTYTYPCPCGDDFVITVDEIRNGETIARCQSCSLIVLCLYDIDSKMMM